MIRPTRPLVALCSTRQLLIAQIAALALLVATCVAGSARAEDVGRPIQLQPQTPAAAADVDRDFQDLGRALNSAPNSKSTGGFDQAGSDSVLAIVDSLTSPTVARTVTVSAPEVL